ncbi:MAG: hypothetical protein N2578_07835, partial [Bdellovibrionaceae bacterium]|nr:hypothetical protein [Pseudobdellovibrionaceae bacterium]
MISKFIAVSLFIVLSVIVGWLGVGHIYPLNPRVAPVVPKGVVLGDKWTMVHILGGKCGCSK